MWEWNVASAFDIKKSNWFEEVEHNAFVFCNPSLETAGLRSKILYMLAARFRNIITDLCD